MSHRRITEIMPVELLCDARGIDRIGITEPLDLEALAWSCGIDTEETYILAAPAAEPDARFAKDRAAVVTEPLDLEALAWSCGIDAEETCILAAPAADHSARFAQDRAAVATTAILQMVRGELTAWLHREHVDTAGLRTSIASFLRDEFNDVARTTLNEIRRAGE